METIVKLSSKNQIVVPKEIRKKLHLKTGDELVVRIEDHKAVILPKPKNYTQYMLGLGKRVWRGVEASSYVKKERESWARKKQK